MRIHLTSLFYSSIIFCLKYNAVEGACIKSIFSDPDLILSPSVRVYYDDGTTVTYSCSEGNTLRGPTTATCTGSSFRPPELPQCKARCRGQGRDYEDGETVPLNCPTGFVLDGSSTSTCIDGEWNPEEPTCLKICVRPSFLNFDLNISPSQVSYVEGDVITYSCEEGHRLYGETTATCTEDGFDPPEVPQCEELLQCHTEKQTVCEPSGTDCDTFAPSSENEQRNVQYCNENAKLCFIYRFGVQGNSVTVNTTTSGCVTSEDLNIEYGCYDRNYLERVDSSGAGKLLKLEKELGTKADNFQVCFCDRDSCNESVETAARNKATTVPTRMKMIWGSLMTYLSLRTSGF